MGCRLSVLKGGAYVQCTGADRETRTHAVSRTAHPFVCISSFAAGISIATSCLHLGHLITTPCEYAPYLVSPNCRLHGQCIVPSSHKTAFANIYQTPPRLLKFSALAVSNISPTCFPLPPTRESIYYLGIILLRLCVYIAIPYARRCRLFSGAPLPPVMFRIGSRAGLAPGAEPP